ncbi:MAG: PAS domain-containing protein [Pseudomonadota bacterium]
MVSEERPLNPFEKESPEPRDFTDSRLVALLAHWRELAARAGLGGLPVVHALDPVPLQFILGWLMIMEPLEGGADFRYRLYGTEIAATTGRDLTGCKVSDSFPQFAAWTSRVYRDVMARKRPMLTRHSPQRYVPVHQWERLILPFADGSGRVARLLVGAVVMKKLEALDEVRLPWPLREDGGAA